LKFILLAASSLSIAEDTDAAKQAGPALHDFAANRKKFLPAPNEPVPPNRLDFVHTRIVV
jgi:hypothetical protein